MMTSTVTTLPLTQRSLVFTASATLAEFLDQTPELAPAIRNRLSEVRLPFECQDFFVQYPYVLHMLLLVDVDTPEMVVVVPVLATIGHASPRFSLQIICATDDRSSLDRFVDELDLAGGVSELDLPLLLVFDEEWNYQCQWGPHPQAADPYWERWFERYPAYEELAADETSAAQASYATLLTILTHEMRVWYNSGLTAACVREVQALLAGLIEEEAGEETGEDDE